MPETPHNLETISKHMAHGVAWTISMRWVLKAVGVANTIILVPVVSKYFNDERLSMVTQIIALQGLILDFENIGIEDF